jgi:hypothetical protein
MSLIIGAAYHRGPAKASGGAGGTV